MTDPKCPPPEPSRCKYRQQGSDQPMYPCGVEDCEHCMEADPPPPGPEGPVMPESRILSSKSDPSQQIEIRRNDGGADLAIYFKTPVGIARFGFGAKAAVRLALSIIRESGEPDPLAERDEARTRATAAENESLVAVLATIERQIEAHLAATGRTWRNSEVQLGDLARMLSGELERLRDRATATAAECERLRAEVAKLIGWCIKEHTGYAPDYPFTVRTPDGPYGYGFATRDSAVAAVRKAAGLEPQS